MMNECPRLPCQVSRPFGVGSRLNDSQRLENERKLERDTLYAALINDEGSTKKLKERDKQKIFIIPIKQTGILWLNKVLKKIKYQVN